MSQEQDPYSQPQSTPPTGAPGQPAQPSYPPPAHGQQSYPPPSYGQQPYGQQSYPPPAYGQPGYSGYSPSPPDGSSEDRTWATISHAGSFAAAYIALGILCPIIVLVAKPNRPFVRHHAYESLNFQLNALALFVIYVVLGVVTLSIAWFLLFLPGLAYVAFYIWAVIRASMAANRGELYRYPLTVRVFNP